MKRRPANELGLEETATRLRITPARLRRHVVEGDWDQVPQPDDLDGFDLRWTVPTVDAFIAGRNVILRVTDIAARLGYYHQNVRSLIRERRFDRVPPPEGRDTVGYRWTPARVDDWFAEREDRLNARQTAEMLGVSADTFRSRVNRQAWHLAPPPAGEESGRRYWSRAGVLAWRQRQGD